MKFYSSTCIYFHLNKARANIIPEEELIASLKARESDAFEYLYDNYSHELFGIAKKILNSQELAEDVLQDTFVKIWNSFATYDATKGRLFTWMLNVARNTALDKLKSKHVKHQTQSVEQNAKAINALESPRQNIDHIGLKQSLSALKPEYKNIIELAYYNGLTQDEISKELGIPLGTVKTKMRAALMELRKVFN
ncbi:MAG: polymerase subunit sigma-70 [Bacteroidetes bacterium]|nr:polymerase subunit sigma-70 [Bacteroidota bacterium]